MNKKELLELSNEDLNELMEQVSEEVKKRDEKTKKELLNKLYDIYREANTKGFKIGVYDSCLAEFHFPDKVDDLKVIKK